MSSDVEHHGEVIRLLIMQGKCIVGGGVGSRTFRVAVAGRRRLRFLGQTINRTEQAFSLVCVYVLCRPGLDQDCCPSLFFLVLAAKENLKKCQCEEFEFGKGGAVLKEKQE